MKNNKDGRLIFSIIFCSTIVFIVHAITNPEPSILANLGYAVFMGAVIGIGFYFLDTRGR